MAETNAPFFVDRETITLTANGLWMSDGTEITHEQTRRLFAKSLKKNAQGYFLQIGRETKRVQVEDTAYFVHRVDGSPDLGYELWVNDESQERLDPATLSYRPGRLTCRLKRGEQAKFLSAPYFDVLKHLEESKDSYFLRIQGNQIPLATKSGP